MSKLKVYLKSGNVVTIDRVHDYKITMNIDGGITYFSWANYSNAKNKLKGINMDSIECIVETKK